jgi:hypothetical protein
LRHHRGERLDALVVEDTGLAVAGWGGFGSLDSILDMMFGEHARTMHTFDVQRAAEVSHHAMMSTSAEQQPDAEAALDEALRSGLPRR